MASARPGSHGPLYAGDRKTTAKDRKKEIGTRLLGMMHNDLGVEKHEFQEANGGVPAGWR